MRIGFNATSQNKKKKLHPSCEVTGEAPRLSTSQNANNIQQRVFTKAKKAISNKRQKIDVLLGQN